MSPQLQAAIAAIQPLSSTDRQQLIQFLGERDTQRDDLSALSQEFRQGLSIQALRDQQQPMLVQNIDDLKADFWPEEDSIDAFLGFLSQMRQEIIALPSCN
jgi:hypothetical protein